MYEYEGYVSSIDNENVIRLIIDLGFRLTKDISVTLAGIEMKTEKDLELAHKRISKLILKRNVIVKTYQDMNSEYKNENYSADIFIHTETGLLCVNDVMVIEGYSTFTEH